MTGPIAKWFRAEQDSRGYKRSFYRKSLLMIALIACIPGLIVGAGIYFAATKQIENELQRLHQSQIKQRAENIDDQLVYLELTFSHWTFDPKFDQRLKDLDFKYKYDQVQELYRTMIVIEGSHPLIENVELYLNKPRLLTMNKEKYTFLTDPAQIDKYNAFMKQNKTIFWTDEMKDQPGADGKSALTLVTKLPGGSTEPFGVLVATLDKTKLSKLLRTLTPYNEGSTLLMSGDGGWVISGGDKMTELDKELQAEYRKRQGKAESFLMNYKNVTYSVSSGTLTRLGTAWVYLSAAPVTAITSPVVFISKLIVFISLVGLLLALLFSWLASNRLYTPIDRVVRLLSRDRRTMQRYENKDEFELIEKQWNELSRESESLQGKLEQQLPLVREGFMLQLVQGYLFSYSERDIREKLKTYGRDADGHSFVAVMIQLRGLSSLEGRFSSGDEELVSFAAANIIEELAQNLLSGAEIINFHDMCIGVLIHVSEDTPGSGWQKELRDWGQELIRVIGRILKLQMTISISKATPSGKQIPYIFEEARRALSYRTLPEGSQVIDLELVDKTDMQRKFSYPFSLEKEIIHSIRMGSEDAAAELIGQFLSELSQDGATELIVRQGMLQLLGSILNAMVHSGMNPVYMFAGANLFDELSQQNGPEDNLRWFKHRIVRAFIQELISKQDFHLKQMVEQVILYLNERYMTDLSLESCADYYGTSPYTLSRAFKQITGINFIDYLTNIRLVTAKQLLKESELKITEVAEKVGYQQSYFNRIFKKYEGVTPSQFRDMVREA
ncbi:AraC family transcriptional regulator [Paenibacillus thalictri]|uniref:AraC family transcriptional regulator n=1 Tax=Paenibacillus thalictri TaxID=2527873 RepID=A0A4Q9DIX3_9BACL|nr:AraC family transcriptional regulator [Paenibacillus thalictri]TBL70774.1 AraC family transcriptional regulator [Paenibacillus thalictri]